MRPMTFKGLALNASWPRRLDCDCTNRLSVLRAMILIAQNISCSHFGNQCGGALAAHLAGIGGGTFCDKGS